MIFEFILFRVATFYTVFSIVLLTFFSVTTSAQTINVNKGDVTGLPLPRFVSIKSNKVNVRRGPNSAHQIDWVYTRSGIPLKVTAEYEHWRRVEDFEGEGGWIHSRLLSGARFVIFLDNKTFLKRRPNEKSPSLAVIQHGVIAKLVTKAEYWSEISTQGYSGWIPNISVWGTSKDNTKNIQKK